MNEKLILFGDGPHAGRYLLSFDPDHDDGRGSVESTDDPTEALRFPNALTAWEEWKRASTVHPVRLTDGKPNRPMTAFTITVIPADEA